jgi:hypothetical protein
MKLTHPDIATLVTPLSASRIERNATVDLLLFLNPLSTAGKERMIQQSADRVSKIAGNNSRLQAWLDPSLPTHKAATPLPGEGTKKTLFLYPLSTAGEERVIQQSADRVSLIASIFKLNQQ